MRKTFTEPATHHVRSNQTLEAGCVNEGWLDCQFKKSLKRYGIQLKNQTITERLDTFEQIFGPS